MIMKNINTLIISVSVVLSAYFIGHGLQTFNRHEKKISVKGLAEKEIDSDLAVWIIEFNNSAESLEAIRRQYPETQQLIQKYLINNGIQQNEISVSSSIKDRLAQDYDAGKGSRFIANGSFVVTSREVEKIQRAKEGLSELLQKGVVITNDRVQYYFTRLNEIKPEMLDTATRNAKSAADGFAKSMNVNVGQLLSASQGVFSIENSISTSADNEYSSGDLTSIRKKVRVVIQVEFSIN